MKYTREQLENMGLNENQINAILNQIKEEDTMNRAEEKKVIEHSQYEVKGVLKERPVNHDELLSVTSISDLQKYKSGTIVRLPDFAEGQPFVARLRRPSMLVLAKQGKIPNALLNAAGELFMNGGSGMDVDNSEMLSQIYDVCKIICESALLQPTLAEIESVGMELSDEQMMAIFNYSQNGIEALKPFRKE